MKYQEQWEQFEETGKVADYLAYCRQAGQMSAGNMMDGSALGMALAENVMWSGSVRNAGEGDWDRGDNGTPQEGEYRHLHRAQEDQTAPCLPVRFFLPLVPLRSIPAEILTVCRVAPFRRSLENWHRITMHYVIVPILEKWRDISPEKAWKLLGSLCYYTSHCALSCMAK